MRRERKTVYFDGGCRPNPGPMETAVVVNNIVHHRRDLGRGGSEEAEWLALLHALEIAASLGLSDILLRGDAAGVIAQANGTIPARACAHHRARFLALKAGFAAVRLRHIPRTQNLAGIALARARQR